MQSFQNHYFDVVQRDLILSENLSTASLAAKPKKISLCLGGSSSDDHYVVASLAALKMVSGKVPYFTQQKGFSQNKSGPREGVGGKITLRRCSMYFFLHKLVSEVLPGIRQFEGLRSPAHKNVYCFLLEDMFSFQELVPLFPYFEDLDSLQCQFHFTTASKAEMEVLGHGLHLCFLPGDK